MRARGLKHPVGDLVRDLFMSRPMRARGLKLDSILHTVVDGMSRPMRERGLKPFAVAALA